MVSYQASLSRKGTLLFFSNGFKSVLMKKRRPVCNSNSGNTELSSCLCENQAFQKLFFCWKQFKLYKYRKILNIQRTLHGKTDYSTNERGKWVNSFLWENEIHIFKPVCHFQQTLACKFSENLEKTFETWLERFQKALTIFGTFTEIFQTLEFVKEHFIPLWWFLKF